MSSRALAKAQQRLLRYRGRPMDLVRQGTHYPVTGYSRRATDDDLTGAAQQFDSVVIIGIEGLEDLGTLGVDESARIARPDAMYYDGRLQTVEEAAPRWDGDRHVGWRLGVKG